MNIIPIAFAFDNNLILPACICISSLLMNAKNDTYYDIFILYSAKTGLEKKELNKLPVFFKNCRVQYREVDDTFDSSFEIRGITTPAYYRLLIPELVPEYDKVIYSDVDIIFRMDLSDLYNINIEQYYLAATRDLGLNFSDEGIKYISSVEGLKQREYLQSGFIMMNCKKMMHDNMIDKFRSLARRKLKFQDQDILNLTCGGNVLFLPAKYNMTDYSYYYLNKKLDTVLTVLAGEDVVDALLGGNIHFNGHKPWKKYSVNFDIWWEYYRKSPFFDKDFYFDFFYNKLDELDKLSLWKRVKIVIRYFIYGIK